MTRLRSLFQAEWTWRLFCVLAIAGFVGTVWLDLSNKYWSFLPSEWQPAEIKTKAYHTAQAAWKVECKQRNDEQIKKWGSLIPPPGEEYIVCWRDAFLPSVGQDGTRYYWPLPDLPRRWALFDSDDWRDGQNWFFLAFLFGPFAIAKSLDWILAGRAEQ